MKTNDKKALQDKTVAELAQSLADKRQELTNFVLEMRMGKVKNLKLGSTLRRDIAVLETIKRQKEITQNG